MCGAQRRRARRFRRPRSKIRRRVQETCRPHRRTPGNRITALQRPAWIRDKRVSVHSDLSRRRRRDNGLAAIAASARGRGDRVKPGRSFILASRPQLRPLASIPPDGAAETRRRAPNGAAARHRRCPVRIPRAHRWTPKGRSRAGVRPTTHWASSSVSWTLMVCLGTVCLEESRKFMQYCPESAPAPSQHPECAAELPQWKYPSTSI